MTAHQDDDVEFTVDELAMRVGMTVRNVRAYAGRGLIPAPRLSGRTGYYNNVHVQKLQLVRELVDRGYTLAAVEKAVLAQSDSTAAHALDLLGVLGSPATDEEETVVMTRSGLAALAGADQDDSLVDQLIAMGLVEPLDDKRLTIVKPAIVRAGTSAMALGLSPQTVTSFLPVISDHLSQVASILVDRVREEIWQPFVDAGMPEEDWARVLTAVEALLPVAGQAVLAVFKSELGEAINEALGQELGAFSASQADPTQP